MAFQHLQRMLPSHTTLLSTLCSASVSSILVFGALNVYAHTGGSSQMWIRQPDVVSQAELPAMDWHQDDNVVDQVQTVYRNQDRTDATGLQTLIGSLASVHPITRRKAAIALASQVREQGVQAQYSSVVLHSLEGYAHDKDPVVRQQVQSVLKQLGAPTAQAAPHSSDEG